MRVPLDDRRERGRRGRGRLHILPFVPDRAQRDVLALALGQTCGRELECLAQPPVDLFECVEGTLDPLFGLAGAGLLSLVTRRERVGGLLVFGEPLQQRLERPLVLVSVEFELAEPDGRVAVHYHDIQADSQRQHECRADEQ